MEIILGLVIVLFVAWVALRAATARMRQTLSTPDRRVTSAAEAERTHEAGSPLRAEIEWALERDFGSPSLPQELRSVETKKSPDHVPPSPSGDGVEAWSPRTQQFEVAGEWYRAANLRAIFAKHAKVSESGAEIRLTACLIPDPTNPYDNHAVAVYVDGMHVGYMERSDAKEYHHQIAQVPDARLNVTSRQWLRASADDTWARVTISLPPPGQLVCPNLSEIGGVLLPTGSTIQVTREDEYIQNLGGLLDRYGSETVVAATLRSVIEQRPRSTVELVAVDIDAAQVGVLSTTQTANFLVLVKRAEAEGRQIICRASLRGNSLKADVALHARKAHELNEIELKALFTSTSI